MSVSPVRFLAVGDVMVDVVVSGRGHEASVLLRPGGCAANAAVWAAACGAHATVVGRIGDDLAGRGLRAALEERSVETLLEVDDELATGTFVLVDGGPRADRGANAGDWTLPPELEADAVLVSGHIDESVAREALGRARSRWLASQDRPLAEANALFVGEQELGDSRIEDLAGRFRLVCVTHGAAGAAGALDGEIAEARPPETAEGTALGAGDAFAAAVLVTLAAGRPLSEAIAEGCRIGALAAASRDGWPYDLTISRGGRRKESP